MILRIKQRNTKLTFIIVSAEINRHAQVLGMDQYTTPREIYCEPLEQRSLTHNLLSGLFEHFHLLLLRQSS